MSASAPMPVLVLLHGIGGSAAGFRLLVDAFAARGLAARAWSQPGYDGEPLVAPYDFETCAAALAGWLGRERPGPVVLVGHSMGGMVAQTLWRQWREAGGDETGAGGDEMRTGGDETGTGGARSGDRGWSIAGLVLAHTSPAFGHGDGDFQRRFVDSRLRPLDEGLTMRDLAERLAPTLIAPGSAAPVLARAIAMMAAVPAETYRRAVRALTGFDGRAALAGIAVPTLCLAAEHDRTAAPEVLARMAAKIPAADYDCLPGLGHLAPIEDPERWADSIAAWCARRLPSHCLPENR